MVAGAAAGLGGVASRRGGSLGGVTWQQASWRRSAEQVMDWRRSNGAAMWRWRLDAAAVPWWREGCSRDVSGDYTPA